MESFKVLSPSDALELDCLAALPSGKPCAAVQILHGMCETKEKYIPFMEYLSSKGIASVIHDQRGHGRSIRDASDLGYMYSGGWEAMTGDALEVRRAAQELFPECSHALLGHSMGSLVARSVVKRYDSDVDCLILCGCPGYNPWCSMGQALTRMLGRLKGDRHRSHLLQRLTFGSGGAGSDRPGGFIFTVNGFSTLASLMRDSGSADGWTARNPQLRVLFASGEEDRYMRSRASFVRMVRSITEAGYRDTRIAVYPGMPHDILNGREKSGNGENMKVWKDIADFMR